MTPNMRPIHLTILVTLAVTSASLQLGCGKGASATPTITYRAGGDSAAANGGEPVKQIDGSGTLNGTITLVGTAPTPTVIVAKGTFLAMPALQTTTSSAPYAFSTAATMALALSVSVTSR